MEEGGVGLDISSHLKEKKTLECKNRSTKHEPALNDSYCYMLHLIPFWSEMESAKVLQNIK